MSENKFKCILIAKSYSASISSSRIRTNYNTAVNIATPVRSTTNCSSDATTAKKKMGKNNVGKKMKGKNNVGKKMTEK